MTDHDTSGGSVLYIDCFSGIAGDMMLAACMDLDEGAAGAIHHALEVVSGLGFKLVERAVERSGVRARAVSVELLEGTEPPERSFEQIRRLIEESSLDAGVKQRSLEMFRALAVAEGAVHGRPPEDVHFHEVGAVDSIVDVVGVAAALDHLCATVHSSHVPLGRGFVSARHGTLPVPAPATLALLEGVPVYGTEVEHELVTPTGASILATQVASFGPIPPMRPIATGWGAGARDHAVRPGLLRVVLGEPLVERSSSPCVVLESNIDDMTGEVAAYAIERALEAGALDAWVTPITMKKGRPAFQLGVLCERPDVDRVAAVVLAETTTIGLRLREVERITLPRHVVEVETRFGPIAVKVSGRAGGPRTLSPEFEACRAAARRHEVPLKDVIDAATAAAIDRLC